MGEVKLKPGWFLRDVAKAAARVKRWTAPPARPKRPSPTGEVRLRRAMERLTDNKVDSLLQLYSDIAQALDTIESLRASLTRVEEERDRFRAYAEKIGNQYLPGEYADANDADDQLEWDAAFKRAVYEARELFESTETERSE